MPCTHAAHATQPWFFQVESRSCAATLGVRCSCHVMDQQQGIMHQNYCHSALRRVSLSSSAVGPRSSRSATHMPPGYAGAVSKPPSRWSGPQSSAVVTLTGSVAWSEAPVRLFVVRRCYRAPTLLASLPSPAGCDRRCSREPKPLASFPRPLSAQPGSG